MAGNGNSGRRRRPTHLKLVEGRHYRLNKHEPVPEGALSEAPEFFTATQRAVWDYVIQNAPRGLLKRLDAATLQAWVAAKCLHDEAMKALQSSPRIIKSPNGMPVQSPWIQILNKQASIMQRLSLDLGFSPAARARISLEIEEESDPADRYFDPA